MKRKIKIAFALIFLSAIISCNPMPQDVTHEISLANESFMTAFNDGNAAAVAENYTPDARLLPPNSNVINGTDEIQNFWQGAMDMGVKKVTLETLNAMGYGTIADEEGNYTLYTENNMVIDRGKYVVIWKKEAGAWKLFRDIWNSNNPAPIARATTNDTVWVVQNIIKPDKVDQFEDYNFNYLEPAAAEYFPKMRNTVRTLRPVKANKDGTYTYFYLMDPATSPDGYDMMLPLTAKYGKDKAKEYLDMFTDCLKGGKQDWIVSTQTKW
jgi:ketosteroid isomerase-like protein